MTGHLYILDDGGSLLGFVGPKRDQLKAGAARAIAEMVGRPSLEVFRKLRKHPTDSLTWGVHKKSFSVVIKKEKNERVQGL